MTHSCPTRRSSDRPVAEFWPAGNRKALAEMIVAAANHAERDRASTRQLASDGILRDPVLSVWRSGSGEQADHIFATMNGTADDDRTYPFLLASEARYRKQRGRAHVGTPDTKSHLVCRLLLS